MTEQITVNQSMNTTPQSAGSSLCVKKHGARHYEVSEESHNMPAKHSRHRLYLSVTRQGLRVPLNVHIDKIGEFRRDPRPRYAPMRYIGVGVLTLLPLVLMTGRFALQHRWTDAWEMVRVYGAMWCGIVLVFGVALAATETLILAHDRLIFRKSYAGFPYRQREYFLKYLSCPRAGRMRGMIEFTYGDQGVAQQTNLEDRDRRIVLHLLDMLLSCPYHAIETVVFGGKFVVNADVSRLLQNPDPTGFALPLFRLRQILVYPESVSVLALEQFLTYAVNVIGHQELQRAIDVHIYGNPEHLPSHLRNALTNLFHAVHLHSANEKFSGIQSMIQEESNGGEKAKSC